MSPFNHHQADMTRRAAWGLTFALVAVPLLFGVAMACFPGGYSFSKHVVSDLGRTRLSNGAPNTLSCVFFAMAMTVSGLACAFFWLARHTFLTRPPARRTVLASGLAMSALMASIGFTPLNLVGTIHDPVTAATAIAAAVAVLALFADPTDRFERQHVKRAWLLLLISVSAGWTLLVALHHERLLAFRPWLPLGQKTLIATFISWMAYQTTLMFRVKT